MSARSLGIKKLAGRVNGCHTQDKWILATQVREYS